MERNELDKSGHLYMFTSIEALNGTFEAQFFSGLHFTPYQRH